MRRKLNQIKLVAVLCVTAYFPISALKAQEPLAVTGQQLEGAWIIDLASDPAPGPIPVAPPVKTSGLLSRDGTVLIQNVIPDMPGSRVIQGVGEWVRTGNREFALTWTFVIVSTVDGTYIGAFTDRAKLRYNPELNELSGDFTFEVTLADGSKPFGGAGKMKAKRLAIVPL